MPEDKNNTEPGAADDDALERAKENEKKKQDQLDKIFADNKSKRYSKAIDA